MSGSAQGLCGVSSTPAREKPRGWPVKHPDLGLQRYINELPYRRIWRDAKNCMRFGAGYQRDTAHADGRETLQRDRVKPPHNR